MPLLRNNALSNHPRLNKMPRNNYEWQKWAQDLDKQKVDVSAVVGAGAIEPVSALPSLPDTDYPIGSVVFLTTDNKLYRNPDDSAWIKAVDGNDLEADSVLTNAIAAGAITASKIDVSELSAISADMGSLTAGTITLDSTGHIKGGQTDYDTGTGFWLGQDSSTPKFSIGDSSGNRLTWNGSELLVRGTLNITNAQTFSASSFVGFSSDPIGTITYFDLGDFAIIQFPNGFTGTSGGTSGTEFRLAGLPSAITPANTVRDTLSCLDSGNGVLARATITTGGNIIFAISDVSGSQVQWASDAWTASGSKGVTSGTTLMYPTT